MKQKDWEEERFWNLMDCLLSKKVLDEGEVCNLLSGDYELRTELIKEKEDDK